MKKAILLLLPLIFVSLSLIGQGAKRYVLIEHFTNTYCSRCPSGNAALESVLANYSGEYHKISFNPSVPYSQCSFYQANTTDNDARENFYGISFTPTAYLWGTRSGLGSNMLSTTQMDNSLGMTSPLEVVVTETSLTANSVRVEINLNIHDTIPPGDYRLYVAMVEKSLQFNAPNGETMHHDVFRSMVTGPSGITPTFPSPGNYFQYRYDVTYDAGWHPPEMYALAYVQEINTKEVLNSGTRFDQSNTAIDRSRILEGVSVYPNPVTDQIFLEFEKENNPQISVRLLNLMGQTLHLSTNPGKNEKILMKSLNKGTYYLHVTNGDALFVKKITKL